MYLRPKRRRAAALQRVALDFGRLYFGVRWPGSALARLPSHATADRVASLAISRDVPQAKAAPGRRTPKSCA